MKILVKNLSIINPANSRGEFVVHVRVGDELIFKDCWLENIDFDITLGDYGKLPDDTVQFKHCTIENCRGMPIDAG